jgi:hypothetical protein
MNPLSCPRCGLPTCQAANCANCGHVLNGQPPASAAAPVPRPAGVPDGSLPSEFHEWEQEYFDRERFLAGLSEVEQTGGVELKDFLLELESGVPPGE